MAEDAPPAFQFYPRDYIGSTRRMPDRPCRRYMDGLCESWMSKCYGVGTPDEWREWMGYLDEREWQEDLPHLLPRFYVTPTEPVFWVQLRMVEERHKQTAYRRAQSENGRAGNAVRWRGDRGAIAVRSRPDRDGIANDRSASASASASASKDSPTVPTVVASQLPPEPPEIALRVPRKTRGNAPAEDPSGFLIPTNIKGLELDLSKRLVSEWEHDYPAVDVPQTLREIRAWCISNPSNCKTPNGIPRFINRWLQKEQNGGVNGPQGFAGQYPRKVR